MVRSFAFNQPDSMLARSGHFFLLRGPNSFRLSQPRITALVRVRVTLLSLAISINLNDAKMPDGCWNLDLKQTPLSAVEWILRGTYGASLKNK